MTLQSTESRIQYSPNGSTTVFTFPYFFLADADLEVILTTAAGADILQVLTTDYTVADALDPSGGSITMVSTPASGTTLTISRVLLATQLVDYIANDNFPAETHETTLDKLTMLVQMLLDLMGRSIKFPSSEDLTRVSELSNAADRADRILGFDSNGNLTLLAFSSIATVSPGAALITLGTPSGSATVKTISVNVEDTPNFLVKAWLTDTNSINLIRTVNPPDGNGVADFEEITDSNGDVTFSFSHTGVADTWYLIVNVDGVLTLSTALNLG